MYYEGSLLLENEEQIKQKMKETLSFSAARIDVEHNFNIANRGNDTDYEKAKQKAISEQNIRKQLAINFKNFKREYNIFEKLPHFAVYRLKVEKAILLITVRKEKFE
jgi:hypothetical protein